MSRWNGEGDPADLFRTSLADVDQKQTGQMSAIGHRVVTGVLAVVVTAGGGGLLGVHTSTVSSATGSLDVTVDYPRVARPGLDVLLRVEVRDTEPLPQEVALELDVDYLHIFEAQAIYPEPDAQSGRAGRIVLTFAPEPGARDIVIDFDQYVQPGSQRGASTDLVIRAEGRGAVTIPIRTTLAP